MFRYSHEDNVSGLIVQWYAEHLKRGGDPDPIAEELIQEVFIEDHFGLADIKTRKDQ